MDLFRHPNPADSRAAASQGPRRPERARHWSDLLPWRASKRSGAVFVDPFETEEVLYAVCGEHAQGKLGQRFKEALAGELASGRLLVRVMQLRSPAPPRVPGARRLSSRRAQTARCILRQTDARGRPAPWRNVVLRKVRRPMQRTEPHGWLEMERGLFMAWPEGQRRVSEWPQRVPLVIGESSSEASWELLVRHRALAVWTRHRMYLLRQVDGEFPGPFDLHRQLNDWRKS